MYKHEVATLLGHWPQLNLPALEQLTYNQLQLDSRKVAAGDIFCAIRGLAVDGRRFIEAAVKQGAVLVLSEADSPEQHGELCQQDDVPVLALYELPKALSALAGRSYDQPSDQLSLVGITGTNGKTTTCNLIANWLQLLGEQSGVMGTIGNGLYGQLVETGNTTADPIQVQADLAGFKHAGADWAVMEVSSHGLEQYRVEALNFAVAIYTNLSRDHLDYHGDMASYEAAKRRFFAMDVGARVINADDEVGARWLTDYPDAIAISARPRSESVAKDQAAWVCASQIRYHSAGAEIELDSSWGQAKIQSPLLGTFNVQNLLCALAALLSRGYALEQLVALVPHLESVAGRMELVQAPGKASCVVD